MAGEQEPRPVQRVGRGFESRNDQRDEFVEQFVVGEDRALFVRCVHVHRQEIESLGVAGITPRFDDLQQQAPEVARLHDDAEISRRIAGEECERIFALRQYPRLVIVPEDTDQDQFERKIAGLGGDIDRVALFRRRRPAHGERVAALHHHPDQPMHVLAAERRLYHRARAPPHVAVADDQAVAQQHLYPLEPRSLHVLAVPAHENSPDFRRVVDEVRQPAVTAPHAHDVAVLIANARQRVERFGVDAEV